MRRPLADSSHARHRTGLRAFGFLLLLVGGAFALVGFVSFFSAFGGGGFPSLFWCAFVGLPMVGIGAGCLKAGYLGSITRYVASEAAPVAADTADYLARETRGAVQTTVAAVADGLRGATPTTPCPQCRTPQRQGANFCDRCGTALGAASCVQCKAELAPDARFCSACGAAATR